MTLVSFYLIIKKYWELFFVLLFFWIIILVILIQSLILNNGHVIYSLDDVYIHMAIAKNFSKYGVWGVTKKEFSSSSSSLLYSLLLSFLFLFGPYEIIPLIINLVFSNLIILEAYYILKIKKNIPSYAVIICLVLIILLVPLHFLIFTGMEHTIQICLDVLFFYIASLIISKEEISSEGNLLSSKNRFFKSDENLLLVLAPLITMVRFEGMFFIIVISALFFLRRKFFYSIKILVVGFIPIIISGLISTSFGWFFFPNSVILKGNLPDFSNIYNILEFFSLIVFIKNPHILILLMGALFIIFIKLYKKEGIWNQISIMSMIFTFVLLLHVFLIGIVDQNRNLSRYEGYLITIGILLFFIYIKDFIPKNLTKSYIKIYITEIKENYKHNSVQIIVIIIIFFFLFWTFIPRTIYLLRRTPQATNNIYEQQYQMGLFLKEYYNGECVALNDIGAVNYIADIECLDLRGLGSKEIADSMVNDNLDEDVVYKAAERRDCKIAIIYEDKDYGYDIPSEWIKVGEWKIKYNVVAGDDTVSFWAIESDEIAELIENLQDFSNHLPHNVEESGNYTK